MLSVVNKFSYIGSNQNKASLQKWQIKNVDNTTSSSPTNITTCPCLPWAQIPPAFAILALVNDINANDSFGYLYDKG